MSWKEWPCWRKGGTIGLCLWIIIFIFLILIHVFISRFSDIFLFLLMLLDAPLLMIGCRILHICSNLIFPDTGGILFLPYFILSSAASYFLIGAVIGLIVGVIKRRKKSSRDKIRISKNYRNLRKADERMGSRGVGHINGYFFIALLRGQSKSKLILEIVISLIISLIFEGLYGLDSAISALLVGFCLLVFLFNLRSFNQNDK